MLYEICAMNCNVCKCYLQNKIYQNNQNKKYVKYSCVSGSSSVGQLNSTEIQFNWKLKVFVVFIRSCKEKIHQLNSFVFQFLALIFNLKNETIQQYQYSSLFNTHRLMNIVNTSESFDIFSL